MKRLIFTAVCLLIAVSVYAATSMTTLNTSEIILNPQVEKVFDRADTNFTNLHTDLETAESAIDAIELADTYSDGSIQTNSNNITSNDADILALEQNSLVWEICCEPHLSDGSITEEIYTGTGYFTRRAPFAFTVTDVRASLDTAGDGSYPIIDINEGGVSILSTKLTIDEDEKTSTTAQTAAVISDTDISDDAEITIDLDQVGTTYAGKGLKVVIYGDKFN